jgi:hypothetical protein
MIKDGMRYHDKNSRDPDWLNLLTHDDKYQYKDEIGFPRFGTRRLKPEVIKWLNDNVKDISDSCNENTTKAWAVGNDEYNATDSLSFSLFFQRQTDAMKFIKHWSHYKNPVDYLNYFKDIRRKLNFETGRLQRAKR